MRGIYCLVLKVGLATTIRVGSLGLLRFHAGTYIYVGSALGKQATSIEGRVRRHFGARHRIWWHIDYLMSSTRAVPLGVVYAETRRQWECQLNRRLLLDLSASQPHRHFGSSDCACESHLLFVGKPDFSGILSEIRRVYRVLCLDPSTLLVRSRGGG